MRKEEADVIWFADDMIIYPIKLKNFRKKKRIEGIPGGTVVKNPPANAGDMGSSPDPGRSHMPRSN